MHVPASLPGVRAPRAVLPPLPAAVRAGRRVPSSTRNVALPEAGGDFDGPAIDLRPTSDVPGGLARSNIGVTCAVSAVRLACPGLSRLAPRASQYRSAGRRLARLSGGGGWLRGAVLPRSSAESGVCRLRRQCIVVRPAGAAPRRAHPRGSRLRRLRTGPANRPGKAAASFSSVMAWRCSASVSGRRRAWRCAAPVIRATVMRSGSVAAIGRS